MKKFLFPLQKVLDVKVAEEKVLQKELGVAQAALQQALAAAEQTKSVLQEAWREHGKNKQTTSAELNLRMNYINSLKEQLKREQETITEREVAVEKAREILVIKAKERKIFEKLKEKKQEEYRKEYNKYEQNFLDDLSQHLKKEEGPNQ